MEGIAEKADVLTEARAVHEKLKMSQRPSTGDFGLLVGLSPNKCTEKGKKDDKSFWDTNRSIVFRKVRKCCKVAHNGNRQI